MVTIRVTNEIVWARKYLSDGVEIEGSDGGEFKGLPKATLILGRDGVGSEADEADSDAWCNYVADRIDERSGFDVTIEIRGARDVQDDKITADNEADERALNEAKEALWDEFCADTSAWPARRE